MNLFNDKKTLILKILNAILVLWFVGATVFLIISLSTLFIKDPTENYTYEEYKTMYCSGTIYYDYLEEDVCKCADENCTSCKTIDDDLTDENCKAEYEQYVINNKGNLYNTKMSIFSALANMVIVGGVIWFLNKEKTSKK